MKTMLMAAAAAVALLLPTAAAAWNARGHMTVAAVAWEAMSPAARREAARLLQLNPDYGRWTEGVPAELKDKVAFMQAATWPDDIRGWKQDDGYDATVPQADDNVGYGDPWVHAYWHFKNIAFSTDGTAFPAPPAVNAIERIETFRDTLSTPATDDVESYALVWLVHLVGDMHQPLHATSRYSRGKRRGDNGGNGVFVCLDRPCPKGQKLHAFWDYAVGSSRDYRSVISLADSLAAPKPAAAAIAAPDAWLQESYGLARSVGYVPPIGATAGPWMLTRRYRADAAATARAQIALAGVRLANLLNARFR